MQEPRPCQTIVTPNLGVILCRLSHLINIRGCIFCKIWGDTVAIQVDAKNLLRVHSTFQSIIVLCCVQTWHLPVQPLSSRNRFLQIWEVFSMMNSTCQKIIRPRRRKIYVFRFRLCHLFAIWHLQGASQVTSVPFLLSQTSSDCEF